VPIVHSCNWQDCGVLTMGEYCIEHEHQHRLSAPAPRNALDRFGTAAAVVAVAIAAGLVRMRVLR
jgi:hypothetical protein